MRKFNVRWWVDTEFLGRREDHNIDTAQLLLENYGIRVIDWTRVTNGDAALRGPKSSTVFRGRRMFDPWADWRPMTIEESAICHDVLVSSILKKLPR